MEGANESEPSRREIRSHILFEVATEVANRGKIRPAVFIRKKARIAMRTTKADASVVTSGWYLLGPEIQSSRYDSRVWRAIYIDWAAQSSLSMRLFPSPVFFLNLLSLSVVDGCKTDNIPHQL